MSELKLVEVRSARATSSPDLIECEVTVTGYEGNEKVALLPFAWSRNDPYGLGPAVSKWFAEHPEFQIEAV